MTIKYFKLCETSDLKLIQIPSLERFVPLTLGQEQTNLMEIDESKLINGYSYFYTLTIAFRTWKRVMARNKVACHVDTNDPPSEVQALMWHKIIYEAVRTSKVKTIYNIEYHSDLEHLHVHGVVLTDVNSRLSNFKRAIRMQLDLDHYDRIAVKFYQKYENKTLEEVIAYHLLGIKNKKKKLTFENKIYVR